MVDRPPVRTLPLHLALVAIGSGGAAGSLGLVLRLEHLGDGYDAEGRLHKVEYNKLDFGSEFAFYDLNDDCVVESADLGLVSNAFGLGVGQQGYNPRFDLDSNGLIDTADIGPLTGIMYGKSCPRFVYDAGGNLTKIEGHGAVQPYKRMVYIGGIYEKNLETQEVTKYYFGPDGRRIAMRKTPSSGGAGTLYFFAQDHLGGTALVMNSTTGGEVSRMGYYPYGMTWTEQGAMPTDRLYTGQQRFGAKSGTYNYVSRFYSADMGRFPQPDSILPNVYEPQALSRYTYVHNNPANFTDPTGHFGFGVIPAPDIGGGGGPPSAPVPPPGYDDGGDPTRPPQNTQPPIHSGKCSLGLWAGLTAYLDMFSDFYYDFEKAWHEAPPRVVARETADITWSNVRYGNSRWSRTVIFADAWGTGNYVPTEGEIPPIDGLTRWHYHIWCQEDAWGNTHKYYDVDPSLDDFFPDLDVWPF
jgi:RHS repeat-associated protein